MLPWVGFGQMNRRFTEGACWTAVSWRTFQQWKDRERVCAKGADSLGDPKNHSVWLVCGVTVGVGAEPGVWILAAVEGQEVPQFSLRSSPR